MQSQEQGNKVENKVSMKEALLGMTAFSVTTYIAASRSEIIFSNLNRQIPSENLVVAVAGILASNLVIAVLSNRWERRKSQEAISHKKNDGFEIQENLKKFLVRATQVALAGVTSGFAIAASSQIQWF